jgi:ABC-2 type transport system ATP-binding protein
MNDHAVNLQGVEKRYRASLFGKGIYALRGVDVHIPRGAIFGLLGPNGAGKSTLVKVMMTVIRPTICRGTILGRPVGDRSTLGRMGYLPEHHRFPDYLTAAQVVDYFAAMSGVDRTTRRARTAELLELVGLKPWANHRIREFSKGMRQRVGIAQSLVCDPELVILDEPTDGVDPVGRRDIRNVLIEQRRRGRTVLLNSHLLSELEMVCDTVAIMVQGKVWAQGTVDSLTRYGQRYIIEALPSTSASVAASAGLDSLAPPPPDNSMLRSIAGAAMVHALSSLIRFQSEPSAPRRQWQPQDPTRPVLHGTLALPSGETAPVELDGQSLTIGVSDPKPVQQVLDAIRRAGMLILSARPIRPGLEELFMKAVTDDTTGMVLGPGANLDAPDAGRFNKSGASAASGSSSHAHSTASTGGVS